MRTLLVLANHPELPEAIRSALSREQYRILHRVSAEEAEPLLAHGMADACILDLDPLGVQGIWFVEKIRRHAPDIPIILFSGAKNWDWEEEAYLQGVDHVLSKPVRPRMLTACWNGCGSRRRRPRPPSRRLRQSPRRRFRLNRRPPPASARRRPCRCCAIFPRSSLIPSMPRAC